MSAALTHTTFRPGIILEAHRFLNDLLQNTAPDSIATETLTWLEERGLVEEVMTDAFTLEYIITARGKQAMLGHHAA